MVDMSCEILRHFSTVPTIKKVLSYPIIRAEILTALTNDKQADGVWYDTILRAVAPFLRVAITREIISARRHDSLLHDILNDKNQYLTEMVDAFLVHLRKSITYFLYYSPNDYHLNSLDGIIRKKLRRNVATVSGVEYKYLSMDILNLRINTSIP